MTYPGFFTRSLMEPDMIDATHSPSPPPTGISEGPLLGLGLGLGPQAPNRSSDGAPLTCITRVGRSQYVHTMRPAVRWARRGSTLMQQRSRRALLVSKQDVRTTGVPWPSSDTVRAEAATWMSALKQPAHVPLYWIQSQFQSRRCSFETPPCRTLRDHGAPGNALAYLHYISAS
ncbi:hypothetical protein BV20DRAFT_1866 [Pilatotrama ljubarskyi]|nr:hypothetical protein BV20DRAFT_1866 [Pilatotrama ljubarskyi]